MAKMFTAGFKPKSTTKKAKSMIRGEIKSFYSSSMKGSPKNIPAILNMKDDADSYNGGLYRNQVASDYLKGSALVDIGDFRIYYDDQRKFLAKIYGKKNVDNWANDKVHKTYKHLIGREYVSMLREREKKQRGKR